MRYIADLHTHSRFSRATSKALDPERLALWSQKKGIHVVGTGDFTHPNWFSELNQKLVQQSDGFMTLKPELQQKINAELTKSCSAKARFVLTAEISCIYKKNGRTRKLHHLILLPDFETAKKFNARLDQIGNITSDGRPILGLDSKHLLEITLEISDRAFFIPAHIWTPWFSLFGSKSGFDSLEECFEDLSTHIHALETGLSSDPHMNRMISALDRYVLVSNSDAHSPSKLGREANVFETGFDYDHMIRAMTEGIGFSGTIEFYPEEGKYHLDGHRKCQTVMEPEETLDADGVCPVCGKPLTVGVLNRVLQLADRKKPQFSPNFQSLIPLTEVLSELLDRGPSTKTVLTAYENLISKLGPELKILIQTPLSDIDAAGGPLLREAIARIRRNQVIKKAGYDGQFGTIRLFEPSEKEAYKGQMALFTPNKSRRATPKKASLPTRRLSPRNLEHHQKGKTQNPILDLLNPEQREAVLHEKGHLLVAAGPGTGKTMTLTHRIAHLIQNKHLNPGQILALTFTRKAAAEMKQRLKTLLNDTENLPVSVFTFHGFCLGFLKKLDPSVGLPPDFMLCSETDAEEIALQILKKAGKDKVFRRQFMNLLPIIKASEILDLKDTSLDSEFHRIYANYQKYLRQTGMLDLNDLEIETLKIMQDKEDIAKTIGRRFKTVCVDEYQDVNDVQVALLKALHRSGVAHIFAIGDPDQAIYGFRGSQRKHFLLFSQDFPGTRTITLTRNYRSSRSILTGAAAVLGKEPLHGESTGLGPVFVAACRTEKEEAEMVVEQVERLMGGTSHFSLDSGRVSVSDGDSSLGFGDFAVLYRLNTQGDHLQEAFDRSGIPYMRSGEAPLISRYPANLFWRFFQILKYPENAYFKVAYQTCLSKYGVVCPKKPEIRPNMTAGELLACAEALHEGIDSNSEDTKRILRRLWELAEKSLNGITSFLNTLSLERGIDHTGLMGDRLALMSLHAAKGLEWPITFITGCENRLLPCNLFDTGDMEEERRLFYVGMTRAKTLLILSHAQKRTIYGRTLHMSPSPFLANLPADIQKPLKRKIPASNRSPHKQLKLF
jgi:DNA helicase-2/ATP-dependent DNA helicase PcrA